MATVGVKGLSEQADAQPDGRCVMRPCRMVYYPRDAMLAWVIAIATCPSVRPSVSLSRAGIVSKRRKLAA